MTPILPRESMATNDVQTSLSLSPLYNDQEVDELKKNYSFRNTQLAKKNEELQIRVTNLEKQLFHTQKQVLSLKNEKIQLNNQLKLNSKRFNDLIIDGFDRLINEYRSFMLDVGIDVERRDIPLKLLQRVSEDDEDKDRTISYEFEHYWKKINDDLQRRKSFIFTKAKNAIGAVQNAVRIGEEDQLDTLVENQAEEEEKKHEEEEHAPEHELEPEYQDNHSALIPVKRQSIYMERIDSRQMNNIPFLGLEGSEEQDAFKGGDTDNNNNELFDHPEDDGSTPLDNQTNIDEDSMDNNKSHIVRDIPEEPDHQIDGQNRRKKNSRRTSKGSRELKNLDTEKTRRWLGMDPLADFEESTGERRRSRRRSLVVNYQLPVIHADRRKSTGKVRHPIYIDEDKENANIKTRNKVVRGGVLKNVTNTNSSRHSSGFSRNITGTNAHKGFGGKKHSEKSIFDLENMDIFGDYDSRMEQRYDMLM